MTEKGFELDGLTVITTHMNADFDAVASTLAAQKLYPDALVVFPGSYEKNMRNFFVQSIIYLMNVTEVQDLDFRAVKRLILVDTKSRDRIGDMAKALDNPDIEIHAYDHHPPQDSDIKAHKDHFRLTGATITILLDNLMDGPVAITPDEATIMALGLYEDTGSFTFRSTTPEDLSAAAYLLRMGADLNIVSDLITREITSVQVGILNDMIQAANTYNVNGVDVVITMISLDHYVPELAVLVQKMIKMQNLNAIFTIALMEKKIHVISRSRIPEVDVGEILRPLGGGGHSYAASASIKEKTMVQVENEILKMLYRTVFSVHQAKDLMTAPAKQVTPDVSLRDASLLLTQYNINTLVVARKEDDKDIILGVITRQILEKAMFLSEDLMESPVEDYMERRIETVSPQSELSEIEEKLIDNNQRILPVLENNVLKGVVTRTDLLNLLVHKSQTTSGRGNDPINGKTVHARTRNVTNFIEERLNSRIVSMLKSIGETADSLNLSTYVVGGFVRDMFLYRANYDIDIVVEGDGIKFASHWAHKEGARIHAHRKFGTAVVIYPDGFKIDVASSRLEYYKFPASLPIVEMSSIKLDLYRRDFTINTLAICLNPDRFGTLIDFFSGQKDIKEKAIRVLHNLSFVEDPTRIFRAIRFEQRFGFSIGKVTSGLIENAVKMDFFKRLSGKRVFGEMKLILEEDNPVSAVRRLNDFNLFPVIHPSLRFTGPMRDLFESTEKVMSWHDLLFLNDDYNKWAVNFIVLIRQCDYETTLEIVKRMELPVKYQELFCKKRFEAERSLYFIERNLKKMKERPSFNSWLYQQLSPFYTELTIFMMAAARFEEAQKAISYYFTTLKGITISVSGKDIRKLGLKPGPIYKEILDKILNAKLDGHIRSKKEEIAYLLRLTEKHV